VERAITGFHCDVKGDWVAELSCGHNQHVRHQPPFRLRPWVIEPTLRTERVGAPLNCPLCDRAELPDGLRLARSSPDWDEHTIPAGLLRTHRVASGTWGLLRVHEGRLQFVMVCDPALNVILEPQSAQAIPPDVRHYVAPLGPVRFSIDFFTIDERTRIGKTPDGPRSEDDNDRVQGSFDEGGDPACWSGLVCPECGNMIEGTHHRHGCRSEPAS